MVFLQHTSEWPAELVKTLLAPTLRLSDSVNVLVSYCHCNKLPQTPRPQNTILLSHGSVSQKSDDSTARWVLGLVLQGWSQGCIPSYSLWRRVCFWVRSGHQPYSGPCCCGTEVLTPLLAVHQSSFAPIGRLDHFLCFLCGPIQQGHPSQILISDCPFCHVSLTPARKICLFLRTLCD